MLNEEIFEKRITRLIKREILKRDLDIEMLAKHLGVTRPTILNYMDGRVGNFTPMFRLMSMLEINPSKSYDENIEIKQFKRIRTALSPRGWCRAKKEYLPGHKHGSCNICKALYRREYRAKGGK